MTRRDGTILPANDFRQTSYYEQGRHSNIPNVLQHSRETSCMLLVRKVENQIKRLQMVKFDWINFRNPLVSFTFESSFFPFSSFHFPSSIFLLPSFLHVSGAIRNWTSQYGR